MNTGKFVIEVCMGSSCFSRSNRTNLEIIRSYIDRNGLADSVEIVGKLCANHCRIGPNIIFNGEERNHVTPSALPALLDHYFRKP